MLYLAEPIPTFVNKNKFNRTNQLFQKQMIKVAVISRGVYRYLNGSIKQPLSAFTSTKPFAEILWNYDLLSLKEWTICDVWTLGLLMFNTKNPVGQGINIDSTAAQA